MADAVPEQSLVVVTLNTHSFQEGADSLEKLRQIGEGLAELDADIVGLNEVMSGTFWAYDYGGAEHDGTAIIKAALEEASGVTWYAAEFGFGRWQDGEEMSNLLLSREPLVVSEHRELPTTDFWPAPSSSRNVVHGRVVYPGLGPVNVFATHTWGWDSVDTIPQINEVKSYVQEKREGDEVIEIVMGDLNVLPTSQPYSVWTEGGPVELIDTYAAANPDGFEDSTQVNDSGRIDYIFVSKGASAEMSLTSSLVFDGSSLPVVSDHKGVATVISLAR
jgi:endonuclease/exonuclease/phosphatase family metal-dependent hydrolase